MFFQTWNKCQWGSKQNDDPNNHMNPCGMGVGRDGRKNYRNKGNKYTVGHTGRRKGYS